MMRERWDSWQHARDFSRDKLAAWELAGHGGDVR